MTNLASAGLLAVFAFSATLIYNTASLRTMRFQVRVNNRSYSVEVLNADPPIFEVSVNGKKALINIGEKKEKELTGNEVVAEMSGSVVRIVVREGQEVKEGEPIMILEAMKMENEVVSPKTGKIEKILVKEGDKVNQGDTLVLISGGGEEVRVSISGVVTKIIKREGQEVKEGEPIMILEAMKMENEVVSPKTGKIEKILVKEGDKVNQGDTVAVVGNS